MKGSIKKDKKTGQYYFVVDIGRYTTTGKRRQKKKRGFTSKPEAEIALAKLLSNLEEFEAKEKIPTFDDFIASWFVEREYTVEKSTFENNKAFNKYYLSPNMGHVPLNDISLFFLQSLANKLVSEGNLEFSTIHKIFNLIKVVLQKAVKYGHVKENYARFVDLPKLKNKEKSVWTSEQVNHFLLVTKKSRYADSYYTAYMISLLTGLRQGETLGLRWSDVSFHDKLIHVRQTLSHDGKTLKSGTKTVSGMRTIHIPQILVDQLKKLKSDTDHLKAKKGKGFIDNDLVICTKKGTPVLSSNLIRAFKKDTVLAKLPQIRWHDMRHTHASILIAKNVNPKLIQERLGHARIGITLDIYSHVIPSMQKEVADQLEKMIVM